MLEWLAASTGVELGKLVFEQVLDLGKPVLEEYVQDFFKGRLNSAVARLNASALKPSMAEAIGYFVKRFVRELQINDVPGTSIEHHYKANIKRFVRDKAVRPILGKAFEKDCKQINYEQLEHIWTQQYEVAGWQFPAEEFDWRGISKEYVYEVKGIIKANAELRSLLETELLEDIARNIAQLSPGFDLETYRASLQSSYGYLKLYTLDSTDRTDAIKLWAMFIEQTVREALPPLRYELPSDLKRRLQDEGQLEDDLSPEALEHYRREYLQQPAQKVLKAAADSQRAVILGDPGSGKSSLLQYLALEWVEGKTSNLPLLIELREFAIAPAANFLEFLHSGRGVDWQFDQQHLHQHLLESPTLVMFDGLDEVFDRTLQSTIIDDIIRFSQQYPMAQVLVTSRIIGYNPERLRHSGFQHFTIQSLDGEEIHEFIDRWYDLSMGSDPDKARLKQRLKDAIANSQAIANLADNPLLLTMMAILNRRQELPRDRADLYDQASRVLLYQWDIEHKRLKLPMDAIGRREKQEMLRLIAYEMQAGEEGLKGNLISADRLIRVLTDYLRAQDFSEPREKANILIQQLRERNFILCYRGADAYGFMHRTFLEYFCAVEIVHHFEKQRILTFEQLRDEVFGQHWQDETWHEVLKLICGMIDSSFAESLIILLIGSKSENLEEDLFSDKKIGNLILATECFIEAKKTGFSSDTEMRLLDAIKLKVEDPKIIRLVWSAIDKIAYLFAQIWRDNNEIRDWLRECLERGHFVGAYFALNALIKGWHQSINTYELLKKYASEGSSTAKRAAIRELARNWKNRPDTFHVIKDLVNKEGEDSAGRQVAVQWLAQNWKDEDDTFSIIKGLILKGVDSGVCAAAVMELFLGWKDQPETLSILKNLVENHQSSDVRMRAVQGLEYFLDDDPEILKILSNVIANDPFEPDRPYYINPRQIALEILIRKHIENSKTLELLKDRAINDPDEKLRQWAHEQLEKLKVKNDQLRAKR